MTNAFEQEVKDIAQWFNKDLGYKPTTLDVIDVVGRSIDVFEEEYICTELNKAI